jgi:hypothetical protein
MRTGRFTPAESELHGWGNRIVPGVVRVLLGAGLLILAISAHRSLLERNWTELSADMGLLVGILMCLSWRRAWRHERIFA